MTEIEKNREITNFSIVSNELIINCIKKCCKTQAHLITRVKAMTATTAVAKTVAKARERVEQFFLCLNSIFLTTFNFVVISSFFSFETFVRSLYCYCLFFFISFFVKSSVTLGAYMSSSSSSSS